MARSYHTTTPLIHTVHLISALTNKSLGPNTKRRPFPQNSKTQGQVLLLGIQYSGE